MALDEVKAVNGVQDRPKVAQLKTQGDKKVSLFGYTEEEQKRLLNDKDVQKQRKEELFNEYQNDLKLTKKQAKKKAKEQLKNELAEAKVSLTKVYYSKDDYKAAKENDKKDGYESTYLKKSVRKMVDNNQDRFYDTAEDGTKTFSEQKYKETVGEFAAADYKLNLDERKAGAAALDSKKNTMKKAARAAGYEVERDNTNLYKAGAFLGAEAAGATLGGIANTAFNFTTNVFGIHANGAVENLGTMTDKGAFGPGAIVGAIAALPGAIALAAKVKDNGYKDIFQGESAEEIVAHGSTGVIGDANKKMVDSVLAMKNLTPELKADVLKIAYGESTGKKVNNRELAAAYEIAKDLDAEIGKLPQPEPEPTPTPAPTPAPDPAPAPAPEPPAPNPPAPAPEPEYNTVTVMNGESLAKLAKKYGMTVDELKELNKDQLKNFKNAKDCNDNRIIKGFLAGAQIKVIAKDENKDAIEKNKETNKAKEAAKYNKTIIAGNGTWCDDRLHEAPTIADEKFINKNNIKSKQEVEAEAKAKAEAEAKAKAEAEAKAKAEAEKKPSWYPEWRK